MRNKPETDFLIRYLQEYATAADEWLQWARDLDDRDELAKFMELSFNNEQDETGRSPFDLRNVDWYAVTDALHRAVSYTGKNFSNWETRIVGLWMDSDEHRWRHLGAGLDRYLFAREIEIVFLDQLDEIRADYAIFGDLLSYSLDQINWHEIADAFMAEAEHEK